MRRHRWTRTELADAFDRLPAGRFSNQAFFDVSFQVTGERWHSDGLRRALASAGLVARAGRKNKKVILWEKLANASPNVHSRQGSPLSTNRKRGPVIV